MRGAIILIAIGFVLNILPLISFQIGTLFGILGLILIWCWIVILIKRFHDGGKSGWMCIIPIIAFLLLSIVVGQIVTTMFAGDINAQLKELTQTGDLGAVLAATQELAPEITKKTALPSAIAGAAVSYVIALIVNSRINADPNDNKYGPAS